uniref:Cell surface adhesin n=1 Tax=uncultured haloarchaeon TaxID=160804 RepID=A0A0K1YB68_9EURY|nr:cell surface adhesin [uncultured haloarchaeon]
METLTTGTTATAPNDDGAVVSTFTYNSSGASESVTITATGGGLFGETTVTIEEQSQESASVTFNDQSVQNGTEEVTVDSANFTRADGSAGDYVVVVHVVNDTEFDIGVDNSISAPVGASGNLSNGAESITVDLNSSAAFEDGDALDTLSENVTLRAMLHTTANDSAFDNRLGNAIAGIEPGDETDDANITVEEAAEDAPANFEVSNVTPDGVNVTAGDNITVNADIENVGGQQATQSVEFRIVATDGNTSIDNASATRSQNVTLNASANDTVTFENVSTDGLTAGDFTHGVFSENDSATATITVEEDAENVTVGDQEVPVRFTTETENGDRTVTADNAVDAINTFLDDGIFRRCRC